MGRAVDLARLLNSSGLVPLNTKAAGVLPDANAPSGSVIQVVQAVKTDTQSTVGYSMVDAVGLSVNLTPINANSKFLVSWRVILSGDFYATYMSVVRNSTHLFRADASGARPIWTGSASMEVTGSNTHGFTHPYAGSFLDSPNSASPLTYKIQFSGRYAAEGYSGTTFINRTVPDRNTETYDGRFASNIVVMEIAP